MKDQRINRTLIYSIVFVFTFLLCKSIYVRIGEISGALGYQKLSLNLKDNLNKEKGFSINEVNELEKILPIEAGIYYAFDRDEVSTDLSSDKALICGVKGSIEQFSGTRLKSGVFFDNSENENESVVAVIDEEMAKRLFKSEDVAGLKLYLYGLNFTVIGVVNAPDSIVEEPKEERLPLVYIPLNVMDSLKTAYITNIEISGNKNYLDKALVEDTISALGKDVDHFYIEDFEDIGKLLGQRTNIIIFILGIFCIFLLLRETFAILKNTICIFRKDCKEYYIIELVGINKKYILRIIVYTFCLLFASLFIWRNITFDFYLPPHKVPIDPTSLSQYFEIIEESIREFWKFDKSSALPGLKTLVFLRIVNESAFLICIFCEAMIIINFYNNFEGCFKCRFESAIWAGLTFFVSIILSVLIIHLCGLPIDFSIKSIVIIYAAMLLFACHLNSTT